MSSSAPPPTTSFPSQRAAAPAPATGTGTVTGTGTGTGVTVFGSDHGDAATFRELAHRLDVRMRLTGVPLSAATADLAAGARCVSIDHKTRVGRPALRALRRVGVEYLSSRSVGSDHVDVAYARRLGIVVETVSYSPDSVADFTLMLMLMALRDARTVIRRTDAHDYRLGATPGRELRDLTVGVVGTGRIGTAVVDRLRGFGCRVLAHDQGGGAAATYVPLAYLLRHSDVLTLHAPLNPDTHHLLDARRIALMKPGALVVNTGRGGLLDTEALVAALESGRLGGAALDVLEGEAGIFYADRRAEPPEHEILARLQRLPNVVVTPHTAYFTDHALADLAEYSLAGCVRFETGRHHG